MGRGGYKVVGEVKPGISDSMHICTALFSYLKYSLAKVEHFAELDEGWSVAN